MTLLALVLGLVLERLFTHLLHLREIRWFDLYVDRALQRFAGRSGLLRLLSIGELILLPVLPVLLIQWLLHDWLIGVPALAFAVVVLFFSLGPKDLAEEVDIYARATEAGDRETAMREAKGLLETEPPKEVEPRARAVSEAIFVQANNRIFGVVLWFALLGPVGAWLFRVSDLVRRRAAFEAGRHDPDSDIANAAELLHQVHGVLAWLPARMVALGYALAGSFEDAVSDWRGYYEQCSAQFFQVNEEVVACVGYGAMARRQSLAETEAAAAEWEVTMARSAMGLVRRTLVIWLTVIGLLTLYGWAV